MKKILYLISLLTLISCSSDNPINSEYIDSTEILTENDSVMYIEGIGFIHLNVEIINYDE